MKTIIFALLPALALAFCPQSKPLSSTSLSMAPKYDKQSNTWSPSSSEEGPEAGYDIWGTLVRQGPGPFYNRVFKADDYEQAVLKFMAGDKVGRKTAQAEMDAYLRNPADWQYNRVKGYNVDYLKIDNKQVALTIVWAIGILALGARGVYSLESGENFWAIFGMTSKAAWCEANDSCLLK